MRSAVESLYRTDAKLLPGFIRVLSCTLHPRIRKVANESPANGIYRKVIINKRAATSRFMICTASIHTQTSRSCSSRTYKDWSVASLDATLLEGLSNPDSVLHAIRKLNGTQRRKKRTKEKKINSWIIINVNI